MMPQSAEGTREPFSVTLRPTCALQLEKKCAEFTRARQVYDGLIWRVSRDPSCGPKLALHYPGNPKAAVHMVKTRASHHYPTVSLIYLVEGQEITIVDLKIFEAGHDPIL